MARRRRSRRRNKRYTKPLTISKRVYIGDRF